MTASIWADRLAHESIWSRRSMRRPQTIGHLPTTVLTN